MADILVAALYKFVTLPDFEDLQAPLLDACNRGGVKGTLLLASEGINGTIAGPAQSVRAVRDFVLKDARFEALSYKESRADEMPFYRMKVRLKKEIVTMGVPGTEPNKIVGTYVKPEDWNALISDPDVIVIDTRNDYEVEIGTFEGAINPKTETFREFPAWVADAPSLQNKPKVAMYCTGGIRCEKSTAYLKELGYDDVYHLEGGILKYLETVPKEESMWQGECFVFDARVSVGHGLEPGPYDQCYACRRPIDDKDKASPDYVKGVSCTKCIGQMSEAQRQGFAERQKQIELSEARGEKHIAAEYDETGRAVKQRDPA
jgi:UPF0176 protein